MDDLGVQYTDKKVEALEKKLEKAYKQASKEIGEKLKDFTEKSAAKESKYLQMVKDGTMTQDAFNKWKQGQVFYGDAWKSQQQNMAKVLADTNKTATAWINGEKADVFAFNGNYTAYDMEHGFGVNFGFDLYSEDSVKHLLQDNPKILPKSSLSISKDEKWNMRNIRSQITQGILQGESIPKIADRLANLIPERNRNQMVLHARTAMTSAQNAGRQERYKEAEALGIKFKKVWLATLDARTRPEHQDADGQAVKPDEDFTVGGEKLAYPGDPSADPAMTYNCRCTMVTELDDYPSSFDRRAYDTDDSGHRESYITKDTTYKEWVEAKKNGTVSVSEKYGVLPTTTVAEVFSGHRSASFTPATSIGEAEQFARQFLGLNGTASYNGIGLEYANACNKVLADIQENYDVSGLHSITKMNKRSKLFQNSTAEAAYRWGSGDMFINGDFYKNEKIFTKHVDEINDLMKTIKQNGQALIDSGKFTGKRAEYVETLLRTGRQCVSQSYDFAEGTFVHECGHMLDDKLFYSKIRKEFDLSESMKTFGGGISGYAVSDTREYVAESFTAWWYGEGDICDPKLVKVFEGMMKK